MFNFSSGFSEIDTTNEFEYLILFIDIENILILIVIGGFGIYFEFAK